MNTDNIAMVILAISCIGLEVSGLWLYKLSKRTSQRTLGNIGITVCVIAFLILLIGIAGLVSF